MSAFFFFFFCPPRAPSNPRTVGDLDLLLHLMHGPVEVEAVEGAIGLVEIGGHSPDPEPALTIALAVVEPVGASSSSRSVEFGLTLSGASGQRLGPEVDVAEDVLLHGDVDLPLVVEGDRGTALAESGDQATLGARRNAADEGRHHPALVLARLHVEPVQLWPDAVQLGHRTRVLAVRVGKGCACGSGMAGARQVEQRK